MTRWSLAATADTGAKHFRDGTHRTVNPERTVARLTPLLPLLGITRVANVTGLDVIGVPVVTVMRPNSRSLAVSQGKGLTLAAARASGLMESVENWHAENIALPLRLATYDTLRHAEPTADAWRLPLHRGTLFHDHHRLLWISGWDLLQEREAWVPFELVHTDFTLPMPSGAGCFLPSSNGLASGNHPLEAVSHALCELIERDAITLWRGLDPAARRATRIDLATVDDPGCRWVLDRFAEADVQVGVWEATSDVGLPVFACTISEVVTLRRIYAASGMGCHSTRRIALLRALTEAAQSRLTMIAGSRDDMTRAQYDHTQHEDVLARVNADLAGPARRAFGEAPNRENETFALDVAWELEGLRRAGIHEAVVVDLTRPELEVPVVRAVVPGLESSDLAPGYVPGDRARRCRGGKT